MSLTHITTCLLCDPTKAKKFVAQSMPDLTPGEQPPEAVGKLLQALGAHLAKDHPQALTSIQQMGAMFQALILMKNFQTTDPGVHRAADLTRHFIHKLTQKEAVPDSKIREWYDNIAETASVEWEAVPIHVEDLCALRDMLLEDGQYAPQVPEPSRIVTA